MNNEIASWSRFQNTCLGIGMMIHIQSTMVLQACISYGLAQADLPAMHIWWPAWLLFNNEPTLQIDSNEDIHLDWWQMCSGFSTSMMLAFWLTPAHTPSFQVVPYITRVDNSSCSKLTSNSQGLRDSAIKLLAVRFHTRAVLSFSASWEVYGLMKSLGTLGPIVVMSSTACAHLRQYIQETIVIYQVC